MVPPCSCSWQHAWRTRCRLAEPFPCPDTCFSARFGTFLLLKGADAITAGVSPSLGVRRSNQPDHVQAWDFSSTKRTVLSRRICPGMFSLWDDLKSLEPSWTAEGFGCSLLPPSGSEPCCLKATDTCFSPNLVDYCSWHRPAGAAFFLWISWNCLCMKSPSSQKWESSSSSPGLRAPLFFFFFGLLHSASWLFGGGWSLCTCVGQVPLVLGE